MCYLCAYSQLLCVVWTVGAFTICIDATNEYVEGRDSESRSGIHSGGLQCVTVLIGVFDKATTLPIIGELNANTREYTTRTVPVLACV